MSNITENQKLVMLGLRSPNQSQSAGTEITSTLKNNISEDWDTYVSQFDSANLSSWADYENWLVNNGVSSDQAASIRSKLESKYPDWATFKDKTLNDYTSWFDWEADFQSNVGLRSDRTDADGQPSAGIKVHEEDGITRAGDPIEAGGVEVFGREVHFAQTGPIEQSGEPSISYSNLTISDTTPYLNQSVDISADVSNTSAYGGSVVAELIVDSAIWKAQTIELGGNTTKTVTFTTPFTDYDEYEVKIGPLPSQTVTVQHDGIQ